MSTAQTMVALYGGILLAGAPMVAFCLWFERRL